MRGRPERSSVRWNILALITLASFVAYVLRTNMSVAGAGMMRDLGLSQLQLGGILAAFAWGYALFQFPGGVLGDRIGVRRALTIIAIGWGVLNVLVALVPGTSRASPTVILAALIGLRFLMGAMQAPIYPITGGGAIHNWFPVSGWAFPNGMTNVGLTFGAAATGPLIVWLMERVGWRASFVVTAPLAFLVAAIWWWYGRDRPAEHRGVSRRELELIDANRPASEEAGEAEPGAWKLVIRNRDILLLAGSYFSSNYVFYFFFNWLFIYLVDNRHFQLLQGGYFAAAPWLTGAVGAAVGGVVCDRLCKRIGVRWGCRLPAIIGLTLSGGFLLAAARAESAYVAVVFLSLCMGFNQFIDSAYWAAAIAVSGKHSSAGSGVMNTGGNAVGGVVALLVPLTVEHLGWVAAIGTGTVFALFGALLWFWIYPDRALVEAPSRAAPAGAL